MSSCAKGMPDPGSDSEAQAGEPSDPTAEQLTSLAALTMIRQQPGLVLPVLSAIPTSYTYTQGGDLALNLARSLVKLGLGSVEMWKRLNGNIALFIRTSLNEWLSKIGVGALHNHVSFDFAIIDDLDTSVSEPFAADEGKLLILLETSDGCGFITIGEQVDLLEKAAPGLGRAFYIILTNVLYSWMRIYDVLEADAFVERWKESIEMDMEPGDRDPNEELTFEEHCRQNGIDFPDIAAATPACLRTGKLVRSSTALKRYVSLLQQHRNGPYSAWIDPVLAMAAIRQPAWKPAGNVREQLQDGWDDSPLPNWIMAFRAHDPITQAFDEESQNVYETSHAPIWLDSFDPADVLDVRRVLTYVQRFVEVNLNLVKLSKVIEKGSTHGSTNRSELNDELRAA